MESKRYFDLLKRIVAIVLCAFISVAYIPMSGLGTVYAVENETEDTATETQDPEDETVQTEESQMQGEASDNSAAKESEEAPESVDQADKTEESDGETIPEEEKTSKSDEHPIVEVSGDFSMEEGHPTNGLADNDDLLLQYLENEVAEEVDKAPAPEGTTKATNKKTRKIKLSGADLKIYKKMSTEIKKVADGYRESTVVDIPVEDVFGQTKFTKEELGVSAILNNEGNAFTDEAKAAFRSKFSYDAGLIVHALLADMPYELYWFDKTRGYSYGYNGSYTYGVEYIEGKPQEYMKWEDDACVEISFDVSDDYSKNEDSTTVDTAKTKAAAAFVDNAAGIITNNIGKSDLEKLTAYKEAICAATDYNDSAAGNNPPSYGDPWQLIWVFDEDPGTRVVCEGYSKAFQFLCDNSAFSSSKIGVHSVTGTMDGGTGQGAHMWNIVHMDDGKNYIADITNCDDGIDEGGKAYQTVGYDSYLFLTGALAGGSVAGGYGYNCDEDTSDAEITYEYDKESRDLYSDSELTMATDPYNGTGVSETGTEWTIGWLEPALDASGEYQRQLYGYTGEDSLINFPSEGDVLHVNKTTSEGYFSIDYTAQKSGDSIRFVPPEDEGEDFFVADSFRRTVKKGGNNGSYIFTHYLSEDIEEEESYAADLWYTGIQGAPDAGSLELNISSEDESGDPRELYGYAGWDSLANFPQMGDEIIVGENHYSLTMTGDSEDNETGIFRNYSGNDFFTYEFPDLADALGEAGAGLNTEMKLSYVDEAGIAHDKDSKGNTYSIPLTFSCIKAPPESITGLTANKEGQSTARTLEGYAGTSRLNNFPAAGDTLTAGETTYTAIEGEDGISFVSKDGDSFEFSYLVDKLENGSNDCTMVFDYYDARGSEIEDNYAYKVSGVQGVSAVSEIGYVLADNAESLELYEGLDGDIEDEDSGYTWYEPESILPHVGDKLLVTYKGEDEPVEYVCKSVEYEDTDGDSYTENVFVDENDDEVEIEVFFESDQYENPDKWKAGGEDLYFTVNCLGGSTKVPVTINECPIESVSFTPNSYSIKASKLNGDYFNFYNRGSDGFFADGDEVSVKYKAGSGFGNILSQNTECYVYDEAKEGFYHGDKSLPFYVNAEQESREPFENGALCVVKGQNHFSFTTGLDGLLDTESGDRAFVITVEDDLTDLSWGAPIHTWEDDLSKCTAISYKSGVNGGFVKYGIDENPVITETPATCTEPGTKKITATFTDPDLGSSTWEQNTAPLDHDWGDAEYKWAADHSSCTATRSCKRTGCTSEPETETDNEIEIKTTEATCTKAKTTTYTASFGNEAFPDVTDTVTEGKALGHIWSSPVYTWAEDHSTCTASRYCMRGDCNSKENETAEASSSVTKAATCTGKGEVTYTASFNNSAFEEQNETAETTALGHSMEYHKGKEPSCTEEGTREYYYCTRCKKYFTNSIGSDEISEAQIKLSKTPHNMNHTESHAATCNYEGCTEYWMCWDCKKYFSDSEGKTEIEKDSWIIPATGQHSWNEGEVTTEPTCDTKGVRTYTCTVCSNTKEEDIPALSHIWGDVTYTWDEYHVCTATRTCSREGCVNNTETEAAAAKLSITKQASLNEDGEGVYTATFKNPDFETQTQTVTIARDVMTFDQKDISLERNSKTELITTAGVKHHNGSTTEKTLTVKSTEVEQHPVIEGKTVVTIEKRDEPKLQYFISADEYTGYAMVRVIYEDAEGTEYQHSFKVTVYRDRYDFIDGDDFTVSARADMTLDIYNTKVTDELENGAHFVTTIEGWKWSGGDGEPTKPFCTEGEEYETTNDRIVLHGRKMVKKVSDFRMTVSLVNASGEEIASEIVFGYVDRDGPSDVPAEIPTAMTFTSAAPLKGIIGEDYIHGNWFYRDGNSIEITFQDGHSETYLYIEKKIKDEIHVGFFKDGIYGYGKELIVDQNIKTNDGKIVEGNDNKVIIKATLFGTEVSTEELSLTGASEATLISELVDEADDEVDAADAVNKEVKTQADNASSSADNDDEDAEEKVSAAEEQADQAVVKAKAAEEAAQKVLDTIESSGLSGTQKTSAVNSAQAVMEKAAKVTASATMSGAIVKKAAAVIARKKASAAASAAASAETGSDDAVTKAEAAKTAAEAAQTKAQAAVDAANAAKELADSTDDEALQSAAADALDAANAELQEANTAVTNAENAAETAKTAKAVKEAKESALGELDDLEGTLGNYDTADREALQEAINKAREEINSATSVAAINTAKGKAVTKFDSTKTTAEKKEEAEKKREAEEREKAQAAAEAEAARNAEAEAARKAEAEADAEFNGTRDKSVPKVKGAKVKAAKKSFTVSWSKANAKTLKKYAAIEVQYSMNRNFPRKETIRKVLGKKKTSLKAKKLAKGKTYYVRVRYFKRGGSTGKLVGAWTKVKKIKVK